MVWLFCVLLSSASLAESPAHSLDFSGDAVAKEAFALLASGDERRGTRKLIHAQLNRIDDESLEDRVWTALTDRFGGQPGGVEAELARFGHQGIGKPFPLKQWRTEEGKVALSDFEGPTVVHVWATWCPPCIKGMPHLDRAAERWEPTGVNLVSLSIDNSYAKARALWNRNDWTHDWGYYGESAREDIAGINAPNYFILDDEGVLRYAFTGWKGEDDPRVDATLEALSAR